MKHSPYSLRILRGALLLLIGASELSARAESVDWTHGFYTDRYNYAYGVVSDHQGNAFLAGTANPTPSTMANPSSTFFGRVNSQGQPQWKQIIGAADKSTQVLYANSLTVSPSGTILLTLTSNDALGSPNPSSTFYGMVINYDIAGNPLWYWRTTEPNRTATSRTDPQGNVFVVGGAGSEMFVGKLNSAGIQQWRTFLPYNNGELFDVAIDSSGNSYTVGGTFASLGGPNAGSRDVFFSKFNSAGVLQWTKQFGTIGNDVAYGGIEIDPLGNLLLSGGTYDTPQSGAFLRKFDPSGNPIWARQFAGDVRDMTLDLQGNAYLAGSPGLVRYDTNGILAYTAPAAILNATGTPSTVYYDPIDLHLYVGGISSGTGGFNSKISRLTVPVPEPDSLALAILGSLATYIGGRVRRWSASASGGPDICPGGAAARGVR